MYFEGEMSCNSIAIAIGTSAMTARKLLISIGIDTSIRKTEPHSRHKERFPKKVSMSDAELKDFLCREYVGNNRSMTSIAKELNVSHNIVKKYLLEFEISTRTKKEQQSGVNASNWQGGKHKTSSGYIEVFSPNHHLANVRGYVYEHQLVAEKMLGRNLEKGECVHHIDFDKTNNSEENLLILSSSEHSKLHAALKRRCCHE